MTFHHVFCYGSNLYTPRLRARVRDARYLSTGRICGRRLAFHKRSIDGSAKADAHRTDNPADCVWGAIFSIPHEQKPALDACEFLGVGYDEVEVAVKIPTEGAKRCLLYEARPEAIEPMLQPYDWYLALVLAGAAEHALPSKYIDSLTRTACVVDDDDERRRRHWQLIGHHAEPDRTCHTPGKQSER